MVKKPKKYKMSVSEYFSGLHDIPLISLHDLPIFLYEIPQNIPLGSMIFLNDIPP